MVILKIRNQTTQLHSLQLVYSYLCGTVLKTSAYSFWHQRGTTKLKSDNHYGLERTLKRLKDIKKTWQFQRRNVRWFIDHCSCCQKISMLKIPIHAHGFSTSTYTTMECLKIDFIEPFPDGGYVLVIIDMFTRWVVLYHMKVASALSTAQCLLKHFGRFGAPLQLRSDNGPHFIAEVIKEFLSLLRTQQYLTLAY
jgi:transposase InsO family protein